MSVDDIDDDDNDVGRLSTVTGHCTPVIICFRSTHFVKLLLLFYRNLK